jgi:hypothetical protein
VPAKSADDKVAGQLQMDNVSFPIARLALERTVRLVSTARLRDPVLLKLVDPADIADLEEIEGATSARLNAELRGADALNARELIVGVAHANFINAAFAYFRPKALNRFNGSGRGAWYSALATATCIAEVSYHMTRELAYVDDFNATVDYAEMFASFAGEFVDLRSAQPAPVCLNPDPAVGYPAGNALASATVARGLNGVIHPSVRDKGGTCLVALLPHAVQSVSQGAVLRLAWRGSKTPTVTAIP